MVANVNLLPKREKETSSSYMLFLIVLVLVLGIGATMYVKIQQLNSETTEWQKQLAVVKVKIAAQQKTAQGSNTSATNLENVAKSLADGQLKLLPILKKLTSLLPERGVFQSFSYKDPGTIAIDIRFDDKRDAAYFYDRFRNEAWIKEAQLTSLKAVDILNQQENANVLPRYVAHYEITVDKEKAKDLEKEDKQ